MSKGRSGELRRGVRRAADSAVICSPLVRTLTFSPGEIANHWRVLSRRVNDLNKFKGVSGCCIENTV